MQKQLLELLFFAFTSIISICLLFGRFGPYLHPVQSTDWVAVINSRPSLAGRLSIDNDHKFAQGSNFLHSPLCCPTDLFPKVQLAVYWNLQVLEVQKSIGTSKYFAAGFVSNARGENGLNSLLCQEATIPVI